MNKRFDLITVVGYLGIISAFYASLVLAHGALQEVWDPSAFVIIYVGSSCAVFTLSIKEDLLRAGKVLKKAFVSEIHDTQQLVQSMLRYATIARREGIMAIEREATNVQDPFLRQALQLAVDGTSPDIIDQMLSTELHSMEERHATGRAIFENLATFAPSFGMLGTIMHLSLTLKSLDNPKEIGPKMATALLSTFYGVLGCYAIFTPIAKKLDRRSKEEVHIKRLIIRGIMSIQAGDGPRLVESKLRAFLKLEAPG